MLYRWRILQSLSVAGMLCFSDLWRGMGIYLSQERPDLVFVIKELASKMSKPTELAMARMKKFLGYVTAKKDYMTYMRFPQTQSGVGHLKQTKDMPTR